MSKRFDPRKRGSDGPRETHREQGKGFGQKSRPGPSPAPAKAIGSGRPVIYGFHTVLAALNNPRRKAMVLHVTENALNRLKEEMPQLSIAPRLTRPDEIDRLTGQGAVHQGIALEVDGLPAVDLEDLTDARLIIVLDQVTDPHNVGAILRSAAAFAADAVVITERHAPDAVGVLAKTASGGLEHVPLVEVGNLAQTLTKLGDKGFWRVGLDSEGPEILEHSLATGPIALVLGAEGRGLRRLTRERCDVLARLDMPGAIKSLNVSNAAAVSLAIVARHQTAL